MENMTCILNYDATFPHVNRLLNYSDEIEMMHKKNIIYKICHHSWKSCCEYTIIDICAFKCLSLYPFIRETVAAKNMN